jgi:hypothetical protein
LAMGESHLRSFFSENGSPVDRAFPPIGVAALFLGLASVT